MNGNYFPFSWLETQSVVILIWNMFHLFLFPRGRDCLKFLMIRNGTILGKEEGEMSPSHFICSVICSPFMIGAGRRIRGNNCLIPTSILKWQCRLIFESEFWKKFKVTNHRSGVTYGCTDQHLTVEKKNFQSLPSHLADTVEDVKNQPHSRWKIVFLIIQRKWPKFKKWVWPVKIP